MKLKDVVPETHRAFAQVFVRSTNGRVDQSNLAGVHYGRTMEEAASNAERAIDATRKCYAGTHEYSIAVGVFAYGVVPPKPAAVNVVPLV